MASSVVLSYLGLRCFPALAATKLITYHLNRALIGLNVVSKVVIKMLLCPLQTLPLVLLPYQLAVGAASECPA